MSTRTSLWSLDYTEVLWDSSSSSVPIEEFMMEHEWLPMTLEIAGKLQWSGRLEWLHGETLKEYQDSEYLGFMTILANPLLEG